MASSSSSKLLPLGAVRTENGEMVVPATRRADGSVRKPIRIRQGYVPQDEVPKYKTIAQRRREQEAEQQHTSASDPELSLQSLSFESKASSALSDKQTPPSRADQRKPRPLSPAPAPASQAAPAPERKSTAREGSAAVSGARDSQAHRNAELKQELSKLNKLLKETGKLEAQQDGEDEFRKALTHQQQRKIERKQELQRKRNEIIAELNGVAINSASNSNSGSAAITGGPGSTKKKKSFVAIEM